MEPSPSDAIQPHPRPPHAIDKYGPKIINEAEHLEGRFVGHEDEEESAGGFDSTPVPYAPVGYTLKFTFHRATNLPFADFNTF